MTWTVQPTPLELVVTIDGVTVIHPFANPVSNTRYYPFVDAGYNDANQGMTSTIRIIPFLYEGRSIRVQMRTTGGTTSALTGIVKWAKW